MEERKGRENFTAANSARIRQLCGCNKRGKTQAGLTRGKGATNGTATAAAMVVAE